VTRVGTDRIRPVSEDEARRAAHEVLEHPGADGVEVVIGASNTGLTRYANSEIIQNTVKRDARAYVRVVVGDRVATASTNQLDGRRLHSAADRAIEATRASRPDTHFPGLADPSKVGAARPRFKWDEDTVATSPGQRAGAVRRILAASQAENAAGIYETSAHVYAVFTSTGIDCYDAYSRCVVTCLVDSGEATGWGEASSHSAADVDVEAAARRAADKAERGRGARDVEPGDFEVVLEAPAVALMLEYLSYMGFGAKAMIEGESFMSSRRGETVATSQVTVADDVSHDLSVGIGFDFEGVPRRRVAVIDGGRATSPVVDLRTGKQLGEPSTGHFSGSNEFGPYASHIVMQAGDRSSEELIGGVDDGLLVTRFHYVNVLQRPETLLTGMTRDGVFRIRGGEVAEGVHNLRFAQNVLEALASVKGIGRDLQAFPPDYGSFGSEVAPPLHLGKFHFSSRTSH
jgi:PmbA protein